VFFGLSSNGRIVFVSISPLSSSCTQFPDSGWSLDLNTCTRFWIFRFLPKFCTCTFFPRHAGNSQTAVHCQLFIAPGPLPHRPGFSTLAMTPPDDQIRSLVPGRAPIGKAPLFPSEVFAPFFFPEFFWLFTRIETYIFKPVLFPSFVFCKVLFLLSFCTRSRGFLGFHPKLFSAPRCLNPLTPFRK